MGGEGVFLQVIEEELSSSGKDDVPYKIRKSQEPDQILIRPRV